LNVKIAESILLRPVLRDWEGRQVAQRSKAPRPKGRRFPVRWFFDIVPLDPALKGGACGARTGQEVTGMKYG
jgi:hypothetical protein